MRTQWDRGLGPCSDPRGLGPSHSRPQRGRGWVRVRTQRDWGLGPCSNPKTFGCGSFVVMSQESWGMGPWADLMGWDLGHYVVDSKSICFGFGICVWTQDSWVSMLDPTKRGLASKLHWRC
ncbi:hypothetical protein NC651_013783 [Populus alba x Populus x berolinensis]|nr:hypothetical protein NC651_013783 [Populus alba x Populus x berolinensis]